MFLTGQNPNTAITLPSLTQTMILNNPHHYQIEASFLINTPKQYPLIDNLDNQVQFNLFLPSYAITKNPKNINESVLTWIMCSGYIKTIFPNNNYPSGSYNGQVKNLQEQFILELSQYFLKNPNYQASLEAKISFYDNTKLVSTLNHTYTFDGYDFTSYSLPYISINNQNKQTGFTINATYNYSTDTFNVDDFSLTLENLLSFPKQNIFYKEFYGWELNFSDNSFNTPNNAFWNILTNSTTINQTTITDSLNNNKTLLQKVIDDAVSSSSNSVLCYIYPLVYYEANNQMVLNNLLYQIDISLQINIINS